MALALYDPAVGYYSSQLRHIGRAGDFYTAVSVGPLYGRLLAELAHQHWLERGQPPDFLLAEQAAHDGQLCEDILSGLQTSGSELAAAARVQLVEPQPIYRSAQLSRLGERLGPRLSWCDAVADLTGTCGFLVCNELLDAFPVHRVQWTGAQWLELGLTLEHGELIWQGREVTAVPLQQELERLPSDLPAGYLTEVSLAATDWLRDLARSAFSGLVWLADYGLDATEYYDPARTEGTLRRYWHHQMDDRVLEQLGEADLTCHVNFSRLIEVAEQNGFRVRDYADQGRLLTRLATPWLRQLEGAPPTAAVAAELRQFQSLTHPAFMGKSFRVLLLER
jgi:SAM-dependent MidA family methyltransferase